MGGFRYNLSKVAWYVHHGQFYLTKYTIAAVQNVSLSFACILYVLYFDCLWYKKDNLKRWFAFNNGQLFDSRYGDVKVACAELESYAWFMIGK